MLRSTFLRLCGFAVLPLMFGAAQAQDDYPSRPVTVIAPNAAGGASDFAARFIAAKLTESLGQDFVVENRPGANGIVGTASVAGAPADGYTLLISQASIMSLNPALYEETNYDPVADFAPISLIAAQSYVIGASHASGVKTLAELIDLARQKNGELTYATGSSSHLVAATLLQQIADFQMTAVAYQGTSPSLPDLISGRVDAILFTPLSAAAVKDDITLVAITSPTRSPILPDVPTVTELGFGGAAVSGWFALEAPAGTPPAIVNKLHDAVVEILKKPEVQEELQKAGFDTVWSESPEEFAAFIASELDRWTNVIKSAGIAQQ